MALGALALKWFADRVGVYVGRDETGDFAAPWHLEFCQILRVRSVREHFAWGFPMIFMMSNLIVRDESYKSHGTTKTRDTQDSSDVLWNDDRWLLKFDKSKWDLSQLKVGLRHQIQVFLGIIHECIWSWEDGKVCELKSAAMIPLDFCCWWKYERGVKGSCWTLQPNQSSNLVSYLQTFLTSWLFISCNFLLWPTKRFIAWGEDNSAQQEASHWSISSRGWRAPFAESHVIVSRSKSICAIDSHPTSGKTAQIGLYRCTVRQVRQVRLMGLSLGIIFKSRTKNLGTHFQNLGQTGTLVVRHLVLGGDHEASVSQELLGKVEYETSPDSNQRYSKDIQIFNNSFERCLFCRKSSGLDLLSHLDFLRVAEGIVQLVSVHVEKQLAGLVLNLAEGAWWSYNMTIWPVTRTCSAFSCKFFSGQLQSFGLYWQTVTGMMKCMSP